MIICTQQFSSATKHLRMYYIVFLMMKAIKSKTKIYVVFLTDIFDLLEKFFSFPLSVIEHVYLNLFYLSLYRIIQLIYHEIDTSIEMRLFLSKFRMSGLHSLHDKLEKLLSHLVRNILFYFILGIIYVEATQVLYLFH